MDSRDDGHYLNVASVNGQSRTSISQESSQGEEELGDIEAQGTPIGEESGLEQEHEAKPSKSMNSGISKYDRRDLI